MQTIFFKFLPILSHSLSDTENICKIYNNILTVEINVKVNVHRLQQQIWGMKQYLEPRECYYREKSETIVEINILHFSVTNFYY